MYSIGLRCNEEWPRVYLLAVYMCVYKNMNICGDACILHPKGSGLEHDDDDESTIRPAIGSHTILQ